MFCFAIIGHSAAIAVTIIDGGESTARRKNAGETTGETAAGAGDGDAQT